VRRGPDQVGRVAVPRKTSSGSGPGGTFRAREVRLGDSRAGVTQLAECLLPKSERLSAVAPLVVIPPNRPSYTLRRPALGMPSSRRRSRWAQVRTAGLHGDAGLGCARSVVDQRPIVQIHLEHCSVDGVGRSGRSSAGRASKSASTSSPAQAWPRPWPERPAPNDPDHGRRRSRPPTINAGRRPPQPPDGNSQGLHQTQGGSPLIYQSREAHEVVVDGHTYRIGKGLSIEYLARLESIPADWAAAGTIPDGADLVFVPGSNNKAYAKLVQ
jgi:hypothetical protein